MLRNCYRVIFDPTSGIQENVHGGTISLFSTVQVQNIMDRYLTRKC